MANAARCNKLDRLDIAVVGPGLIGRRHLELVAQDDHCRVSAIVVPNRAKYARLAERYGAPVYSDVESLLSARKVDGIIIASPNNFHVDQAITCVNAGVPVLVEKPIAVTYAEGRRLVEAADRRSVAVMVGHHRAHSPIIKAARAWVQRGKLGSIVAVMGSALFYKPDDYFDAGPWRKEIGGGPILINLIHEIGNLRALCGEIETVHAIATSKTRGFAVEDTVVLNFRFVSGALGVFVLSDTAASARSWEQTSRENPAYSAYDDEDCYVIAGTAGSLAIPTMRVKSYGRAEERSWWKPFDVEQIAVAREDPLKCQLQNFVNVIKGSESPIVSATDGLLNLRVIEGIFESIRTNIAIDL